MAWKCVTYVGVWGANLRERDYLGRHRRRWGDNIEMDIKSVGRAWTGLIWLKIMTDSGLL